MPKYLESIQDTRESFTRPVVMEVIRDVMRWTGIPMQTRIQFPGETEQAYQPGTTVDTQGAFNQFESQRMVSVRVTENVLEDHVISISALNKDHPEIFIDNETRVYARPIFSPVEYTIEFKYRAHDESLASKWRDEIIARVATYRDLAIHQPKYYYVFPDMFMRILNHIHELRETGAIPYGETLSQYLEKHMTTRASVITNGDGEQGRWGIRESQSRVLGWFDFTGVPEKAEKEGDTSAHSITITYKFRMERPTACVIEYPIVVNNEVIDEHFRQKFNTYTIPEVSSYASKSNTAMGIFEAGERIRYRTGRDIGIKIPFFIEFNPSQIPSVTRNIMSILTTIDMENKKDLMRFDQLGDEWELHQAIIEFMRDEAPYLTRHCESLLHVSVYRNNDIINPSRVRIDSSLNVHLLDEPDPRHTHHVRLSYVYDWSMLSRDALNRLGKYAEIVKMFVDVMYPQTWEHLKQFGTFDKPTRGRNTMRPPAGSGGYYYPNRGWTQGNSFMKSPNGAPLPQKKANSYDTSYGRDINQMFLNLVIPRNPQRNVPWDGNQATPPGSSSTGALKPNEFNNLVQYIGSTASQDKSRLSWKNDLNYYRVMNLFIVSNKQNQLED